jgi:hypothetical protein
MTTSAQIKKLVQPLLERNPELVISGRFVFFRQVNHILRGIYVDRYSYKEGFRPVWTLSSLFRPTEQLSISIGEQIYPAPEDYWYINKPNIDEKFADRMEELALPRLEAYKTIEKFSNIKYNIMPNNTMTLERSPVRKIYVDLALGNFQEAENLFEMFSQHPDYWIKYFHTLQHYNEMINEVRPMVRAHDKAIIAAKLHEWEAYSVKQLKLEKYWHPSPFPIEM